MRSSHLLRSCMSRDDAYLLDIREAARLAMSYLAGKTFDDFYGDTLLQDAVIRRLEIIGEAAHRVSEHTRLLHPLVPWAAIIGMRNVIVHQYDAVDLTIIWETVLVDLPKLMAALPETI